MDNKIAYKANNLPLLKKYLKHFKTEAGYNIPKNFCKAVAGDDIFQWYYGFFCPKGFGDCDFDCILPADWDNDRVCWICDANTICNFTGYFDSKGIPIFENDLVEKFSGWDCAFTTQITMETIPRMLKLNSNWLYDAIAIGNVYDKNIHKPIV